GRSGLLQERAPGAGPSGLRPGAGAHGQSGRAALPGRSASRCVRMGAMKGDTGGYAGSVDEAAPTAAPAEAFGFDGWWALETKHDSFLGAAVAAEPTDRVSVGTSIAVAFARNPMTVAVQANDVQALSGGRFVLGLGTQIKPHITKRYSMEWS